MKIDLEKGWVIRTFDSRNLILEKDGEDRGYFPDLKSALENFLDQRILQSNVENIENLLREIEKLKKQIPEWTKQITPDQK